MAFEFQELNLKGAFLIKNFYAGDNRGSFRKIFEKDVFMEAGITFNTNETYTSLSIKNVIRGLHFQIRNPQAKLVSVVSGRVWDVIVDLRNNSKTFKQWIAKELSAENHLSFYIPRGFAHGFASLEDNTVILYQCDGKYDKETDTGIRFNDPELAITWPVDEKSAILSARDLVLPSFSEFFES